LRVFISMDTLSRYDIADVVSHMSSKTVTSGVESQEGDSFGALLTKATNGIPGLNTEGKVAESGTNSPDLVSALKQTHEKSGESVKGLEEKHHSDLAALGSFYRGQELPDPSDFVDQGKVTADSNHRIDFEEYPDILNHLKSVSTIELESTSKIENNKSVILGEEELSISENLIRVTTLKHKRPVILGPEYDDTKIKSESGREGGLPDYYQEDARAANINSENKDQEINRKNHLDVLSPKFNGEIEGTEEFTNDHKLSLNKAKEFSVDEGFSKLPKLEVKGDSEVTEAKHVGPEKEKQAVDKRNYLAADSPNLREKMDGSKEFKNDQGLLNRAGILRNSELFSDGKHKTLQAKEGIDVSRATNEPLESEEVKISHEARYAASSRSETKNIINEANDYSENQKYSYMNNENKYGVPEKSNGVSLGKPTEMLGEKYEFKDLSGEVRTKPEISNPVEILVKNEKIALKPEFLRTIKTSHNLTQNNIDSNISSVKSEAIEVVNQELFSSNQLDKPSVLNRSEILPKPVSVSNFNSEIQETIIGQLTKSINGVSKFKVALYPENFGKISIEISYSESAGLKINMIGDNPEATRILEQNLPTLRDNLQSEKLSELIVNLNNNRDSQGFNNKNGKSENEYSGDDAGKETNPAELVDPSSVNSQENLALGSDDGLDTYV
jgi:flagellar hook-length control protein FliK